MVEVEKYGGGIKNPLHWKVLKTKEKALCLGFFKGFKLSDIKASGHAEGGLSHISPLGLNFQIERTKRFIGFLKGF